ncbi:uncharacterized protein LOC104889332 [Beta vulgaris subsp. vulgaris]|uniref:uncharacterized protein LOC104889332 n=1 Tax=Beta vulgaris subsp. vulgaris TaxID=3555 RepID=UPI0020371667|nr:uncharacterized protein LOC104889332 [Beta vulgaris subsp. vulgaris]
MAKTSNEAWRIMLKSYKGDDRVKQIRLQTLRGEFESLSMDDSKSISTYYDRVQSTIIQMKINGENITDERVVQKIIRSLNSDFDNVASAIEEAHDLSTLSIERLLDSLSSHEERMRQQGNQTERANVAEAGENLVFACKEGPINEISNTWYLNTRCSNHMIGKKELLFYLDESISGEVSYGNESKVLVKGKGNMNIQSKDGNNVTLADVYYVPDIFWNLLSIDRLTEKGHTIYIQNGICEIKGKDNKVITRVKKMKNRMFPLSTQPKKQL